MVLNEVDECLLRFVLSFAYIDEFLFIQLIVIIQMEHLLRKKRELSSIKILFSMVELRRKLVMR